MKTVRKINKPVKFFGLTSTQFGVYMLAIALIVIASIFNKLHPVAIMGIVGIVIFLSGILFKNLSKEHKAGNPDYLTSLWVKSATPTKIVDKHKVFNVIMKRK